MAETAPFVNPDIPVCGSHEAVETVGEYLRAVTSVILEVLGEGSVAAIVISGSSTLGELTAATFAGEGTFILSDLDLAVVTKDDSQRDRAKSLRAMLLGRFGALPEAAAMLGPAELGVYSLKDLEIQRPKMGVLEMKSAGRALWGDAGALQRLPEFRPADIPRGEAIVLLYNRCLELLNAFYSYASHDPRDAMRLLYAAAKSFIDVGTALAAFHGAYVPGYRRRLGDMKAILAEHYPAGLKTLSADALMEELSFWTLFKVEPDFAKVARRYGGACDGAGLSEAARRACIESRRPLIEAWASLVEACGAKSRGGCLETCLAMIGTETLYDRLRGWKRLVVAREVSAIRAIRLARYGSPLHLLRLCAVCALDGPWNAGRASLSPEARSFLETYFPVPRRGGDVGSGADAWRVHIVEVWKRWIERFWS